MNLEELMLGIPVEGDVTLYVVRVYPLGDCAHMSEYVLNNKYRIERVDVCGPTLFMRGEPDENNKFGFYFSLKDANILPNKYNKHRAFFDKAQAEAYLEGVLALQEFRKKPTFDLHIENMKAIYNG